MTIDEFKKNVGPYIKRFAAMNIDKKIKCWLGWHEWYCPYGCCDIDYDPKCKIAHDITCKHCGKVKR